MVLALGIEQGLRLYKEKIIRQVKCKQGVRVCMSDEDLRKCDPSAGYGLVI